VSDHVWYRKDSGKEGSLVKRGFHCTFNSFLYVAKLVHLNGCKLVF